MKVVHKISCPEGVDPAKNLPYISWRSAYSVSVVKNQRKLVKIIDPTLAIGWGKSVQLIRVFFLIS